MRTQTIPFNARALALALPFILPITTGCGDDESNGDEHMSAGTDPGGSTTEQPTSSEGGAETTSGTTDAATDDDASTSSATGTSSDDESSSDETGREVLEIVGEWIESYPGGMTTHTITPEIWTQSSDFGTFGYTLEAFDNAEQWVVGQDEGDSSFSRFDWTWDDEDLHYCTAAFGLATLEEAVAAPAADGTNLETGCGGFSWSHLEPA
jgi:hypothetical protein